MTFEAIQILLKNNSKLNDFLEWIHWVSYDF